MTLQRSNGQWTAQATDDGRYFATHRHLPPLPERDRPHSSTDNGDERRRAQRLELDPQQVIDRLTREGTLQLGDLDEAQRAAWRRAIHAVRERGLVPDGKQLRLRGRDRGNLTISLHDPPPDKPPPPAPIPSIPVPKRLHRPHPLVAATRDALRQPRSQPVDRYGRPTRPAGFHMRVSKPHLSRALRLLQGLVAEAQRRGYQIEQPDNAAAGITINGHHYPVQVVEVTERVERQPTAQELRRAERNPWYRPDTHESVRTGRLRIELESSYAHRGRRSRWTDGPRGQVEKHLGKVLAEIEARAEIDEQRRLEREREEQRREEARERALQAARRKAIDKYRAERLREQVDAWRLAADIRAMCDDLQARVEELGDSENEAERRRWLEWARAYADRIDPGQDPPITPDEPEISEGELERRLPWSLRHP